jgi:SAM-dependent methyltransferase
MAAKRQVGPAGAVSGVDASPEMLARAEKKARRLGVEVSFQNGLAQSLPFPAAQFDVVLSTVMLHHLPKSSRRRMSVVLGCAKRPCFQFARRQRSNPSGVRGPVEHPPWFRQRVYRLFFALQIADALHGVPRRVFAPYRGFFTICTLL